jgi:hypothetical protein
MGYRVGCKSKIKKYLLTLPPGYKCKMGYMNPASGSQLVGNMNVSVTRMEREHTYLRRDFEILHPTITFVLTMDNGDPKFIRSDPNINNTLEEFFGRMLTQGVSRPFSLSIKICNDHSSIF